VTERQSGSRWRIHLVTVVHFDDLDIVVVAKNGRDLASQAQHQVDPDAHVGGVDHRDLRSGLGQRLEIGRPQTGRTDDQGRCVFDGQTGIDGNGIRGGEIDDDVRRGEQGVRVTVHRQSARLGPGEIGDILADGIVARRFGAASEHCPFGRQNFLDQHPSHASGAA